MNKFFDSTPFELIIENHVDVLEQHRLARFLTGLNKLAADAEHPLSRAEVAKEVEYSPWKAYVGGRHVDIIDRHGRRLAIVVHPTHDDWN